MKPAARIRTLLVDDEPASLARLHDLVSDREDMVIIGEAKDCREALEAIETARPDLVLLDIHMPGEGGVDLASRIKRSEPAPLVVFVTAFDRHALEAFDVDAVDYLLKPVGRERFEEAMEKIRRRLADPPPVAAMDASRRIQRLIVRDGDRSVVLRIDQIDWIRAAGNYCEVHVGSSTHLLREKISVTESRLDPQHFVRIHRSTIVNIDRVKEIHQMGRGDLIVQLIDGTKLPLSRTYRERIEFLLGRI